MKQLFLTSSANAVIHDFADRLLPKFKKVMFLKTAAEAYSGNPEWLQEDRDALVSQGFEITDFSVTSHNSKSFEKELANYDMLFVSGGNTYYLLQELQKSQTIDVIKKLVDNGMPYIGSSAGSVIAGVDVSIIGDLDDIGKAPELRGTDGIGLVDLAIIPHWGNEKYDKKMMEVMEKNFDLKNKFVLVRDNQYVEVKDDWYRVVDVAEKD